MDLYTGKPDEAVLDYLLKRRSIKVADMTEPGPSSAQLEKMLTAAARVPDHGKLCPWYFIVIEGEARAQVGEILQTAYEAKNPNCREGKAEIEAERFTRAPTVIAVIHRARPSKHPLWEQILTTGAVCQNLVLAANASGFAAQWLTEWYAYNEDVKAALGLDGRDSVAGFIYIGTPTKSSEERDRPDLKEISTRWAPEIKPNKGDTYDREKFDIPKF